MSTKYQEDNANANAVMDGIKKMVSNELELHKNEIGTGNIIPLQIALDIIENHSNLTEARRNEIYIDHPSREITKDGLVILILYLMNEGFLIRDHAYFVNYGANWFGSFLCSPPFFFSFFFIRNPII